MSDWHSTHNLAVDVDGVLWRRFPDDEDRDRERLGPIAAAEVGRELIVELEYLLDQWTDAETLGDVRRQWASDYRASAI